MYMYMYVCTHVYMYMYLFFSAPDEGGAFAVELGQVVVVYAKL